MVYKYLNSLKIDSGDCSDWERHFRVCVQRRYVDEALVFIPDGIELAINWTSIGKVESNTNWEVVPEKQLGKAIETAEQIFLVKDKYVPNDYEWLHTNLGYVIENDIKILDNYPNAVKYAKSEHRRKECSVWQFAGNRFELLHNLEVL